MGSFILTGSNLTLQKLEEIVYHNTSVSLSSSAQTQMEKSQKLLEKWRKEKKTIYGFNTGFGSLSDVKIKDQDLLALQKNLVRSHACGVGAPFSEEEVRAIVLIRANSLAKGYSGVRPLLVTQLLELLNKKIIPFIPQKGSVGASGDLAPSAHLALALIGEGEFLKGKIAPIELQGREGLALINGTQVMAALSALNILQAQKLALLFDIASALSLEAIEGSRKPFHAHLHSIRPHRGQKEVAQRLWKLTEKSKIQEKHKECTKVQDSYSFRCIPQVHGSSQDALFFVQKIIETELNSVTDNPVIFAEEELWISGGNFHGQCLSQAMDFLSIAMTTLVNISERRIEKLLDPQFSGLPPFLANNEGLESGLMLAHVTASSLASYNKILSHPASTDTIPTSGNKEDHVSMGVHAALKAKEILGHAEDVLAIEFLAARQGIELRRPSKTSPCLEKVMATLEKEIPPITKDRVFSKDILKIKTLFPDILLQSQGIVE
ncbi:MAG: histidine ammonia-lyase [Deltaproteobacteria bacterium]|nr:histidine ammonia-lyase [Deltaproteobacteria bacterium]